MLRPDGVLGPLVLYGLGRDLRTGPDGGAEVLAEATTRLDVAFLDGRKVTGVTSDPQLPALQELIGVPAAGGFRARLGEVAARERDARSLLHLLLDDVPGAALVSGYSVGSATEHQNIDVSARSSYRPRPDQCSGFRSGGTIMIEIGRRGRAPVVTGPPAPSLDNPADPHAWHTLEPLPRHGMRRVRRLDVIPEKAVVTVESYFRDSHVGEDGRESVIHEYEVRAVVEPDSWRVLKASATPRVLPWRECPSAADSAGRLVGRSLLDIRQEVRTDFRGISTCTHLNDQLRSLADVVVLAGAAH
ncbi:DUF2889 domain-containing protein [Streptomyces sp. NPDC088746]|uniref:DUF2889 domain-containing protein n=1 Tax=Streptomyces sp. NPDC088746 TaxID=3365885 RepID=UPI0038030F33